MQIEWSEGEVWKCVHVIRGSGGGARGRVPAGCDNR